MWTLRKSSTLTTTGETVSHSRQHPTKPSRPSQVNQQDNASEGSDSSMNRNPFVLPTEEEVFQMREEAKAKKAKERIARRKQKVGTSTINLCKYIVVLADRVKWRSSQIADKHARKVQASFETPRAFVARWVCKGSRNNPHRIFSIDPLLH